MPRVGSETPAPSSSSSMASTIKAYTVPLILFVAAMFYQLFVIPKSFPVSHYDVLGIKRYSSIADAKEAYEKISSNWNLGNEVPSTDDFIKIQYAYEFLTNPSWKSNYDLFGIDEHIHVIDKVKGKYAGESFSKIKLPLLDATVSGNTLEIPRAASTSSWVLDEIVTKPGVFHCSEENWQGVSSVSIEDYSCADGSIYDIVGIGGAYDIVSNIYTELPEECNGTIIH